MKHVKVELSFGIPFGIVEISWRVDFSGTDSELNSALREFYKSVVNEGMALLAQPID